MAADSILSLQPWPDGGGCLRPFSHIRLPLWMTNLAVLKNCNLAKTATKKPHCLCIVTSVTLTCKFKTPTLRQGFGKTSLLNYITLWWWYHLYFNTLATWIGFQHILHAIMLGDEFLRSTLYIQDGILLRVSLTLTQILDTNLSFCIMQSMWNLAPNKNFLLSIW